MYKSDYYFFPCLIQKQGSSGIVSSWCKLGGSANIQGGRGNTAGDVCKIVHVHVNPQKNKKQILFDMFLVSQKPKLSQHNSNLG